MLLARFHDVDPTGPSADGAAEAAGGEGAHSGGRVTLDGVDVRTLAPRWLRKEVVGIVAQEPVLLPGSVYENIIYGRPTATPAEVEAAAR